MIIIAAVEDNNGMMFNHRRVSQDRVLRERILERTSTGRLWMNHYSAKQFSEDAVINIDENFLSEAIPGEYCFVENTAVRPYNKWIESVILYKWNRRYPSDTKFDLDLNGWNLISTVDFPGSSHEKITEEVYTRD